MSASWIKVAAVVPAVVTGAAIPTGVADASTHPSGCHNPSYGGWSDNCWVGASYSNDSYLVTATQTIARLYPHAYCYFTKSLARDGVYGAATKNAIKYWQEGYIAYTGSGMPADGVVGSQTWNVLEPFINYHYSMFSNDYKYYRNDKYQCGGVEDTRSFFRMYAVNGTTPYWGVLLPGGSSWGYMWA